MIGAAVFITACMATVGRAQQPTVVLSVRGIEPLLNDAEFIGNELGQEGAKATAINLISTVTGGKGLAGIDQKKPLGLYWNATAGAGPEMPVAFLPVSDAAALKGLLAELTPDFKETGGQWSMTVNGTKLFAKVSGGYCFVSPAPTSLSKLPVPAKIVNAKYDVALDISIASIPQELKSTFLQGVDVGGRQALQAQPEPATEAERDLRDLFFDSFVACLKGLVNDGDKLTIGMDVDEKTRVGSVDLGLTGKPGTELAKSLTAYGKTQPAFAGIGSDSAPLRMVVSYPTTGFTRQIDAIFKVMREAAAKEIDNDVRLSNAADRETARGVVGKMFDIAQATLNSGSAHSGVVMESAGNGKIRVIGGTRLAKGDDAAKLFDDAVKLAKDNPELDKIKVDAAKHAGARIHALAVDQDEKAKELIGDEPLHLAIRNDSLWISVGGDNLNSLKKALDQFGKTAARTGVPPISIQVKPAALVMLMEKNDERLIDRAKTVAGKPGDKVNFDIAPTPNGAKLRIEFGIDLLQLADKGHN
jgi:hypothetical protein